MKGVILAGGLGSRLWPLTKITNKHLLPVYHQPMIFFPLQAMVAAGIREILLVTGGAGAGDFLRLLENGEEFGCALHYAYQRGEGGIAAEAEAFRNQSRGARIVLKEVPDPQRFGVPVFEGGRIIRIEEKPALPQ